MPPLLEAMRPKQWSKNVFVLAGVVFAGRLFDPGSLLRVLAVFALFCAAASSVYLANDVDMEAKGEGSRTYFEIRLGDAWVWDMYRPARFVSSVRVVTFKDVNVEELPEKEL